MVFLILAIVSSVMIGIIMNYSEDKIQNKTALLLMNYVVCILIASELNINNILVNNMTTFSLSVVNGFFYLGGFILLQYNYQKNGLAYSSIFQRLGVLIPIVLSIVIFKEIPSIFQIVGIVVAIATIISMNEETSAIPSLLSLITLFVFGGVGDFMSKVFTELGINTNNNSFLFYTFLFAFIFCLGVLLYRKEKISKYEVFYGCLIGIPNYFSAKFILLSLAHLPAMIVYPTYSISTIIISSLAGVILFKEKLSKRSIIAMSVLIIAIGLLNK